MGTDGCRIEAPKLKSEEPAYIDLTREARSQGVLVLYSGHLRLLLRLTRA